MSVFISKQKIGNSYKSINLTFFIKQIIKVYFYPEIVIHILSDLSSGVPLAGFVENFAVIQPGPSTASFLSLFFLQWKNEIKKWLSIISVLL